MIDAETNQIEQGKLNLIVFVKKKQEGTEGAKDISKPVLIDAVNLKEGLRSEVIVKPFSLDNYTALNTDIDLE